MATVAVNFAYFTGLAESLFTNVRLHGSWDASGRYAEVWTTVPMAAQTGPDGCACFTAALDFDEFEVGREFRWGVIFDGPAGAEIWGIPTEIRDPASRERYLTFTLNPASSPDPPEQEYYLTHCRRLGANKYYPAGDTTKPPRILFSVWAPNAKAVEVVMGKIWAADDPERGPADHSLPPGRIAGGYVAADDSGLHPRLGPFKMSQSNQGVWETKLDERELGDFKAFDHRPYMFRVTREDGQAAYRTDLYSRCQIGYGAFNPQGGPFTGLLAELDGSVSCSVVVDPDRVTKYFREQPPYLNTPPPDTCVWPELYFIPESEFWQGEFTDKQVPARVEDLIIYELHLGALGYGSVNPGTLEDAINLLDYLVELGVNAVELLPLSEFGGGSQNWGYATSHYFAIEYGGGGRDQFKCFIKEAHRRGLAVIMDVVYNHYSHDAERAEYRYDSNFPQHDIYYWYEGQPADYTFPDGGYVDNMSTAYAPRYHEEMVRKMFISSAAALVQEFHVDGFRVDQTTSIHSYNKLHADGREVGNANIFGAKLLREFSRTLRMIKPDVVLMAEDHSNWDEVTLPCEAGGMGFDATWYSDFYHHLIGDTNKGIEYAKLIYMAGKADGQALAMDSFGNVLNATGSKRVVYNESHDEAGNSAGPFRDPDWDGKDQDKEFTSHRTIVVAVNGSPLVEETRRYAEARSRFAYGMTVLSAGTPMFLFGEEIGAERRFKYDAVLQNKEDLTHLRETTGALLFRFYSELNRLRQMWTAFRSHNIDVVYANNADRVLAFRRWDEHEHFLIVASLNDQPFANGYQIAHSEIANGRWRESFNSDARSYGGDNVGNYGATIQADGVGLSIVVPSNGVVVFQRVP